ncbi:unnamed protein product [Adineta steineri]|uniref:Ion transport domain-containing protein n=1 Tax=Adineta steineri TaxID=433720 RepID=A0A820KJ68_9BILA|nr:unnamed protein product [Adineta steineri]
MIHNVIRLEKKEDLQKIDKIANCYRAPIVRFYYYMIFIILFLGLFSFGLLVDYFPWNNSHEQRSGIQDLHIPITEIILHSCLWCLVIEEAHQFITVESKREFIFEIWSMMDIFAIILYFIGFST